MDEGDVPVFDPLDAYSMSLEIQPDISFNATSQPIDFTPIQTAGLNLIPVDPATSLQIHCESAKPVGVINYHPQVSPLPKLPKQPLSLAELQDYQPKQTNNGLQIQIPSNQLDLSATSISHNQRSPRGAGRQRSPRGTGHQRSPRGAASGNQRSPRQIQMSPGLQISSFQSISPLGQGHHNQHNLVSQNGPSSLHNLLSPSGQITHHSVISQNSQITAGQFVQYTNPHGHNSQPPPSYQESVRLKQQDQIVSRISNFNSSEISPTHLRQPADGHVMQSADGHVIQPADGHVIQSADSHVMQSADGQLLLQVPLPKQSINTTQQDLTSPNKSPNAFTHITPTKSQAPTLSHVIETNVDMNEYSDIPGFNHKKRTVDSNVYINSIVSNHHGTFANIDSYAERCMACIFRKLKNSLADLQTLSRAVSGIIPGSRPGNCISVPRSKDCRITVTRSSQDGSKSTKKIHPHLALFQIFSNPQAQNVNVVEHIQECKNPFVPGASYPDMCINPYHYQLTSSPTKLNAKKPGPKPRSENSLYSKIPKKNLPNANDSDSDCLSDSSGSIGDWEQMWADSLPTNPADLEHQKINLTDSDDITSRIKFLSLKKRKLDEEPSLEPLITSPTILTKLRIIDDLKCLIRSNFDLSSISAQTCDKPRTKTRKLVNIQKITKSPPNGVPKTHLNDCLIDNSSNAPSDAFDDSLLDSNTPSEVNEDCLLDSTANDEVNESHLDSTANNAVRENSLLDNNARGELDDPNTASVRDESIVPDGEEETNLVISETKGAAFGHLDQNKDLVPVHLHTESKPLNLYTEAKPVNLYTETRKKEDELVIKDLLEDIKESFESEFDLDLDHFSSEHESQFDDQEFQGFSIANTFSMSELQEPPQDNMGLLLDEGVSHADMSNDVNTTDNNTAMDIDSSPAAMIVDTDTDGADNTDDTEIPLIVDAWSDIPNTTQQHQEEEFAYSMMYDS